MYEIKNGKIYTCFDFPVSMKFREGTNDFGVIESVMVYDEYRAQDFNYDDGDIFIDLGSHIGTWTVLMAMKNSTFKVYSYEPIRENFDLLLKNIEFNNLINVEPCKVMVGGVTNPEEAIFYTDDSDDFGVAHKFVGSPQGGLGTRIVVGQVSLNRVFEHNKIDKCKVIKTDIEGSEIEAFKNLKPEHMKKIEHIVGEFHPWNTGFDEFYSFFEPYFDDLSSEGEKKNGNLALRRFYFRRK